MIRALIAGRKTQTRRPADIDLAGEPGEEIVMRGDRGCSNHIPSVGYGSIVECPYGGPGRLYVKEGIRREPLGPDGLVPEGSPALATYVADGAPVRFLDTWPWKSRQLSPIHMPRALHRIQLELLEVRVERVGAITREDAIAEGAFHTDYGIHEQPISSDGGKTWHTHRSRRNGWAMASTTSADQCLGSPQMAFANLYNVLHDGPNWNLKPGLSPFDRDPFVWVLRFRVDLNPALRADDGSEDGITPRDLFGTYGGDAL